MRILLFIILFHGGLKSYSQTNTTAHIPEIIASPYDLTCRSIGTTNAIQLIGYIEEGHILNNGTKPQYISEPRYYQSKKIPKLQEVELNIEDETEVTKLFFIRHAEKEEKDDPRNPHLSEEGKERANNWSKFFRFEDLDAIYSTNLFRTMETADPISKLQDIEITKYDPRSFDVKEFFQSNTGKVVLIVGHSNTTPMFVNMIMQNPKYKQIEEEEYGYLYILHIQNQVVSDTLFDLNGI